MKEAIRSEATRSIAIEELQNLVRSQPKIPVDDPRVAPAAYEHVGHAQYRNNFYMHFTALKAVRSGEANETQERGVRFAKEKYGIDLVAFYAQHPELCDDIATAIEAAEPYYVINRGYVELLKLERDGVIPEDGAEVLNATAEHPLGFEAIGVYYWDRINPLLEQAYDLMETISPMAAKLGG